MTAFSPYPTPASGTAARPSSPSPAPSAPLRNAAALFAPAVFAMLLVAASPAQARPSADKADKALAKLREADTNRDGSITRAEFAAYRASQWKRMDRNGDGVFSRDDLPALARNRWDSGERLVALRRQLDSNRDGRITRAEYDSAPTLLFDAADADRNGIVTDAELRALAARRG